MKTITLPQRNFPLTTNALKFMQEAYADLEKLALLGGDNYILSGCVVTGGSVSAGWVVIGGILAPFRAGTIQAYVDLGDPKTTVVVGTGTRVETNYIAYFSSSPSSYTKATWTTLNSNRIENMIVMRNKLVAFNQAIIDLNTRLTVMDVNLTTTTETTITQIFVHNNNVELQLTQVITKLGTLTINSIFVVKVIWVETGYNFYFTSFSIPSNYFQCPLASGYHFISTKGSTEGRRDSVTANLEVTPTEITIAKDFSSVFDSFDSYCVFSFNNIHA